MLSASVRISKINRSPALPADFSEVSFETYIICDNLYQGYIATQDEELLDQLGSTLYDKEIKFKPCECVCIFYWFASLKNCIVLKYSKFFVRFAPEAPYGDDFQPMEDAIGGNLFRAHGSFI